MNKFRTYYIMLLSFTVFYLNGCSNFLTEPSSNTGSTSTGDAKIEIVKPASNDTIWFREQPVEYNLTISKSINFIELWVNDKAIRYIPPSSSGGKPQITIDLDSSYIYQKINYFLRYYDKDGSSAQSTTMKDIFVTEIRRAPYTPYNFTLTKFSESVVNLSWKDSTKGDVSYEIWRKAGIDSQYILLTTQGAGTFNINDENLNPNLPYYYKIRAVNKWGTSLFSPELSTKESGGSGGGSGVVPAPSNLTVKALGTINVELNWLDNSQNENFFRIERRTPYGQFAGVGAVIKNTTAFIDSANGLTPGGSYYYRIKAYSNTDSSWSNEAFVQLPTYVLAAPVITSITNPAVQTVEINWSVNDTRYAKFEIERKYENQNYQLLVSLENYITSFSDKTVVPQHNYTYRIRRTDGTYYSDYSNEVQIFVSQ